MVIDAFLIGIVRGPIRKSPGPVINHEATDDKAANQDLALIRLRPRNCSENVKSDDFCILSIKNLLA